MRVLMVASECAPLVKTGGLADVMGALPAALAGAGVEARVLLPGYPAVMAAVGSSVRLPAGTPFGAPAALAGGSPEGLGVIALDAPHLFDRPGGPYAGPDRADWPDNAQRFAALARASVQIAAEGFGGWRPDVVHAHDWQAGLAPALLRFRSVPVPSVMTVHNMAFQGVFPAGLMEPLGLPAAEFTPASLEYWGSLSFLKAGLVHADRITTVSPTYAEELTRPEFGMGLEGVIAARRGAVRGILNGVDTRVWNPATDPHLVAPYGPRRLRAKAANRAALLDRFGLDPARPGPLFCVVSRLTWQKGIDLLFAALPALLARGGSLALLGTGEAEVERGLLRVAAEHPGAVGAVIGYDEPLSHLLIGGADAILVPSRFEPCGLTQLYGLRYGTLPVVARTGGLADTVIDANAAALAAGVATGFAFAPGDAGALAGALGRACDLWADRPAWDRAVRAALAHPVGWERSARAYADLYAELAGSRPA